MILICTCCKEPKEAETYFYKDIRIPRGYQSSCKSCRAERCRRWVAKHRVRSWLRGIRKRAILRGLEFNLKEDEIVIPEKCPVLGIPLAFGAPHDWNLPSADRVDNNKGYTKENVRIISYRANKLKNDATVEEIESVLNYMKEHN